MADTILRRSFLGSVAGSIGLSGCSQLNRGDGSSTSHTNEHITDISPATETVATSTATIVVEQHEGDTRCLETQTRDTLATAPTGEADARVIQTAFDALHGRSTGGSVFIRNGLYEIAEGFEAIRDERSGLTIITDRTKVYSDYAILRFGHHSDEERQNDLRVAGAKDVLLSGLVLDGDRSNRTTTTVTLDVSMSENVTVRDCVIHGGRAGEAGAFGYGVGVYQNNGVFLENCVIRDAERHGVHPGGPADTPNKHTQISNCTFLNNGTNPTGSAIDIRSNSTDTIVENCYFEGNGRAIKVKGPSVKNVQIRGNVFRDNVFPTETGDLAQVLVRLEGDTTTIALHDNQFILTGNHSGQTSHIIYVPLEVGETVELRDNVLHGSDVPILGEDGEASIELLIISGNTVRGSGPTLMGLRQADRLVLTDNTFESSVGEAKIVLHESIKGGVVSQNTFIRSRLEGLDERFET